MDNEFQITLEDLEKVDNNIAVILKREKLKEIHSLIKSKFESVDNFSGMISFNCATLFTWLNGVRNPRLKVVRRICGLLNIKLEDFVEKVICFNEPFGSFVLLEAFPIKGDPNLASLVAHSFGDGHISISFEFTNKCEELLNQVIDGVNKLPVKNVKVIANRRPNKTPTLFFPKLIRSILVCGGAPIGNKITSKMEIPKWVKNGNKEIKSAFIRALFDDEGSVASTAVIRLSLSKRIDMVDNLRQFFTDLKMILEELGIKKIRISEQKGERGKNGKTVENTITICGLSNCKIFSEFIKFDHPMKMKRLLELLENVTKFRTLNGETKERIIGLLKNNSLTINELSKNLGLSFSAIAKHLNDLESQELVSRIRLNDSRKSFWSSNLLNSEHKLS